MTTVLLIIQLMISIVLIGLILIQRSEGGALGIGGGGGGLMSGRSSANAVTKATTLLGTAFIINCLLLSVAFSMQTQGDGLTDVDNSETGLNIDADSAKDNIPLVDDIPAEDMVPETGAETPSSPDTETPQ